MSRKKKTVEDVQVSDKALTGEEVAALYNDGVADEALQSEVTVDEDMETLHDIADAPTLIQEEKKAEEAVEQAFEVEVEKVEVEKTDNVFEARKAALKARLITPLPEVVKVAEPDNRDTSSAVNNRAKPADGRKGIYVGGFSRMGRNGDKPNKKNRATRTLTHKVYDDKPVENVGKGTTAVDVQTKRGS